MNLRSEVHNAVTARFAPRKPLAGETSAKVDFLRAKDSFPVLIDQWIPDVSYTYLSTVQLAVTRLLMRYGTSPTRVKIDVFAHSIPIRDHHGAPLSNWTVVAIDCATSIVLDWVIYTEPPPYCRLCSVKSVVYRAPQAWVNCLNHTKCQHCILLNMQWTINKMVYRPNIDKLHFLSKPSAYFSDRGAIQLLQRLADKKMMSTLWTEK